MSEIKEGDSFRVQISHLIGTRKVHIDHVFPSIYQGRKLIIYRYYGKHRRWWHECLCTEEEMELYIKLAKEE